MDAGYSNLGSQNGIENSCFSLCLSNQFSVVRDTAQSKADDSNMTADNPDRAFGIENLCFSLEVFL